MNTARVSVVGLLFAGIGLLGLGQFGAWLGWDNELSRSGGDSTAPNGGSRIRVETRRPLLEVISTTSKPWPGGQADQRLVQVVLRNKLAQSLKIVGATSSCQPRGCWAPKNLPLEAGAFSEVVLEFQANWTTDPPEPLPVTLYIGLSRLVEVNLDLLPNAATIRPGSSRSEPRTNDRHQHGG